MIIFDFRIIHGGLPSRGRTRPVAYMICSTGGETDANFPATRIREASQADVDESPYFDELDFIQ